VASRVTPRLIRERLRIIANGLDHRLGGGWPKEQAVEELRKLAEDIHWTEANPPTSRTRATVLITSFVAIPFGVAGLWWWSPYLGIPAIVVFGIAWFNVFANLKTAAEQ
jgi:hypothetical protein